MNRSRLDGKVVAITGGARGIGRATAEVVRGYGARVAIGDIDGDVAAEAADSLGSDVLAMELDVTSEKSFDGFIAAVEKGIGPLDVLVNNAGIMPIGPLLDESHELARRALDVNVSGVLVGMKLALARMVERGCGHVINMASVAGRSPVPGGMTYAASKAAIVSLTESARVEFTGSGVSFTCVLPSFTNTELISGTAGTKFVRTVEPGEVAEAIAGAIVKPRPDVFVPGVLGPVVKSQPVLGRWLRDRANRMLGAYQVFMDFDRDARRHYTERIDGGPSDNSKTKVKRPVRTSETGAATSKKPFK